MQPRLRFKEFSENWRQVRLETIADITRLAGYEYSKYWIEDNKKEIIALRGYNIGKNQLILKDLGYISNELSLKLQRSRLSKGDIVYPCVGTIGNAAVIEENDKFHIQQNIAKITPKTSVDSYFLAQFLMSKSGIKQINKFNATSSQPNVLVGSIRNFEVYQPNNLFEQKKIASFLSAVDEKIAQLTKKYELLTQYKKGVMQKIFSQELRFKADDGSAYPDWQTQTIGNIGEVITGKTPKTEDKALWTGDIQFVTPTDISSEKFQTRAERHVTNTGKLKILPIGSIMFTCIASIGKMSISTKPCITNQQINSIVPHQEFDNNYIYYALLNIVDYIKSTQSTNTLPIINKNDFSKFILPTPSKYEQTKIANFLSAIDEKIQNIQAQLEVAKQYKQGLLQQMFI